MFQAQALHQNKSGNCVSCMCFFYQRFELFYTWKTRVKVWPYLWKCSSGTHFNGRMHSKQTGEKQVDKLIERGIMSGWTAAENVSLYGWRAEENFWTSQLLLILTHSQTRNKLLNEATTTIHVVKWVRS